MKIHTREKGTHVFTTSNDRIKAIEKILENKGYAIVDGLMVDTTSAHVYKTVHDALSESNRSRLESMPVRKAFSIVYKLVK